MAKIIGRNKEIKELHALYTSDQAHLVAIYVVLLSFTQSGTVGSKVLFR